LETPRPLDELDELDEDVLLFVEKKEEDLEDDDDDLKEAIGIDGVEHERICCTFFRNKLQRG
jgi:hypothetical protein